MLNMDLDEILQVFFEETDDHLNTLETLLGDLRPSNVSEKNVNAILRAAHSIKGNSATCGLNEVSKLAHEMESLLDVVRQKQGMLTVAAINLLLEAKDLLATLLRAYRSNMDVDGATVSAMCHKIEQMKGSLPAWGTVVSDTDTGEVPRNVDVAIIPGTSPQQKLENLLTTQERTLQIMFVLDTQQYPVENILQALGEFGEHRVIDTRTPKGQPMGSAKTLYHINLVTAAPEAEIRDTLGFVVEDEESIIIDVIQGAASEEFGLFDVVFDTTESHALPEVSILAPTPVPAVILEEKKSSTAVEDSILAALNEIPDGVDPWGMDEFAKPHEKLAVIENSGPVATVTSDPVVVQPPAPPVVVETPPRVTTLEFEERKKPALVAGPTSILDHPLANTEYMQKTIAAPHPLGLKKFAPGPVKGLTAESRQFQRAADRREAAADAVSLRVNLQKIEQVVDLVGELVIAQNQLQQNIDTLDPVIHSTVYDTLQVVMENTKALQESVLSIRMTPMSTVFNRFYRMVRELNAKLGKNVVMKTMGEQTEMDKILVEKLVDPLAHIIRNAMDHGIENPQERAAAGKSEQGYILLRAFHRANSVVIEILDDGRGMHRDKILQKAEEKGILRKDPSEMTDSEVWNLIFEPGFSTAEQVTDVSGRGVGMDVVKQNITDLNGRIDIFSAYGKGMKITLTLPLTLSILDGLFFKVGNESFVVPVSNVLQTMTPNHETIEHRNDFGDVLLWNEQYVPVIPLHQLFEIPPSSTPYDDGVWMVLESGDQQIILWVDKLEGQQQIVLKSLEKNYRKSAGIFGATIRNDGSVSLIVEPGDVIDMAFRQGTYAC